MHTLPTLPLHLMLALSGWTASNSASAWLRSGWPGSKDGESLARALSGLGNRRLENLLSGVKRYLDAPAPARREDAACVWRQGGVRLRDYEGFGVQASGFREGTSSPKPEARSPNPILLVPSLINRHYILDLHEKRSFARWLAAQGFQVFVLDWGEPGAAEKGYDCAEYVRKPLMGALEFLHQATGRKVTLAGYCMGGVLALAAAQLAAGKVAGLALLATPWDFSDAALPPEAARALAQWIGAQEALPGAAVLALFHLADPWRFEKKFIAFGEMKEGSAEYMHFLALERWVNDGVALPKRVARECFIGWAQENVLARGEWAVDGERITPARLRVPCFAALPKGDRIVPRASAMALVSQLKRCTVIEPGAGHVGMIVGARAKAELWEKFAAWAFSLQCST